MWASFCGAIEQMNYLSLCFIARDEDIYLDEFICYYKLLGVEKFYAYDNGSKIPLSETLRKYGDLVKVLNFPGSGAQMPAYTSCIYSFKQETKWLLVVDVDEFVVPKTKNTIPEILCDYEGPGIGALGINWQIFGSNSHLTKPDGLVIENYTNSMSKDHMESRHIKTCLQMQHTQSAGGDPHSFIYKHGYACVNENYEIIKGPFSKYSSSKIGLNHYCLKSLEEWKINKLARPRADTTKYPGKTLEDFYRFDKDCVEENKDIFRFIPKLKDYMSKKVDPFAPKFKLTKCPGCNQLFESCKCTVDPIC
jgi:hypothetical protein